VALGGEGDPVEAAAKRIHATGFQVEGEPMGALGTGGDPAQGLEEGIPTMVQGLSAGDHHEAGACRRRIAARVGQDGQAAVGVARLGPGVLGVAPGAADAAA
jgi:hypothetical protein